MFDNIGQKIKGLAKTLCWIGIGFSIIYGIIIIAESRYGFGNTLTGLIVMGLGSLGSWAGSLTLYGFGHLIENSDMLVQQIRKKQLEKQRIEKRIQIKAKLNDIGISDEAYIDVYCPNCDEKVSFLKSSFYENEYLNCPFCNQIFDTAQFKS